MPTTKLGDKKYYLGIFFKVSMRYEILLDDHGSNCEVFFLEVLLLIQFCSVIRIIIIFSFCSLRCYHHPCYIYLLCFYKKDREWTSLLIKVRETSTKLQVIYKCIHQGNYLRSHRIQG